MKHKGYDRNNELSLHKSGKTKHLIPPKRPKNIRLGYEPLKVNAPSTKVLSGGEVSASKDTEASKDYHAEIDSNEWEWESYRHIQ